MEHLVRKIASKSMYIYIAAYVKTSGFILTHKEMLQVYIAFYWKLILWTNLSGSK